MGDEVSIDKSLFHSRLGGLVAAWKDPKKADLFGGVGSIVIILGKTVEGPYSKSLALHVSFLLTFHPESPLFAFYSFSASVFAEKFCVPKLT